MNDCEQIILDEIRSMKLDIKNLLLDVNTLKVRATIWGVIGGAIFTVLITVVPLLLNKATVMSPVHSQPSITQQDTLH